MNDAAIEWALKKFSKTKSDAEIATSLGATEIAVALKRKELGLEGSAPMSMKEFAREMLMLLSPEEKRARLLKLADSEFFNLWKMAEGNAPTTTDPTVKTVLPTPIMSLDTKK